MSSPDPNSRLMIVSNRLPVGIKCLADDQYDFSPSCGGLVTGLKGLAHNDMAFLWYGWPGTTICPERVPHLKGTLRNKFNAVPVHLDQETAELYYNGFSNSTIWPLFHYQLDKVSFHTGAFAAYKRANEIFADTMALDLEDGDLVWVHDIHLMLLPLLLRQRAHEMKIHIKIGWFLHTPFPAKGFFDALPFKTEILEGILGADVVGFQTEEDRGHFSNVCSHILDQHLDNTTLSYNTRSISVQIFPIGIEPAEFHSRLWKAPVQDSIRSIREKFRGQTVIVGVDRLDCIKGLPQKLLAFERLLEKFPAWVGKATLVQVVVPSRDDLESHRNLKEGIQQVVGRINGRYGSIEYVPVHFVYKSIHPNELTALYAAADVCFVCSTRDGMNLVCYEYIACHHEKAVQVSAEALAPGTLVLSKFAGAARYLDDGALVVNPWDGDCCADALAHALGMGEGEARLRMKRLGEQLERQTSSRWGAAFVHALSQSGGRNEGTTIKHSRCDSGVALEDLLTSCTL